MNIVESLVQATRPSPSHPHAGEAFFIWRQYTATVEGRNLCLTFHNHTADRELKAFITGFIKDAEEPQIEELMRVMRREGIEFPSVPQTKPLLDHLEIPVGAHFQDEEIAALLVGKLQGLMIFCYFAMTQTLRDDLGTMFYRFIGDLMKQAFTLKQLMDKRGWLMHPPPYSAVVPH
ncbi:MAG TPA: DUF3231 family protein [Symbiobacteriaceae bacterium]|nr:DUF3231 family protein [Symbiobacteriaceae bacterium]